MNPILARILLYSLVGVILVGAGFMEGFRRGELKLYDYQAAEARGAVALVKKIEKVKETVRVTHIKRETQIEQVFVPIEKEVANVPSRPACNVTAGWMRVHDAAAEGGDRRDEGAVGDATDTGIGEAEEHAVVVRNYKRFHQVVNDLVACRMFVTGIAAETK